MSSDVSEEYRRPPEESDPMGKWNSLRKGLAFESPAPDEKGRLRCKDVCMSLEDWRALRNVSDPKQCGTDKWEPIWALVSRRLDEHDAEAQLTIRMPAPVADLCLGGKSAPFVED